MRLRVGTRVVVTSHYRRQPPRMYPEERSILGFYLWDVASGWQWVSLFAARRDTAERLARKERPR